MSKKWCCILLVCLCTLVGCGKEDKNNQYLPKKISDISNGGKIEVPAEYQIAPSDFSKSALWGEWELVQTTFPEDNDKEYIDLSYENEGKKVEVSAKPFPMSLYLRPSWFTSDMIFSVEKYDKIGTDFGNALGNLGLGYGTICLDLGENSLLGNGIASKFPLTYTISDNILAIGVCDIPSYDFIGGDIDEETENVDEINITEFDYEYSCEGYKLTLKYGDYTATYEPMECKQNNGMNFYSIMGLVDETENVDGIVGMWYDKGVLYESSESINDQSKNGINFNEDGTVEIEGNVYNFFYSGDSLSLNKDGHWATYSKYFEPKVMKGQHASTGFLIDDELIRFTGWEKVSWFLENGFSTDVDLKQVLNSLQVSDEIKMEYNGVTITIKAANPYDTAVSLGECIVCSLKCDERNGRMHVETGLYAELYVGQATYDDIYYELCMPYENTESTIMYKVQPSWVVMPDLQEDIRYNHVVAKELTCNLIYEFKDDILSSIRYECPNLLYLGLDDNIPYDELAEMDSNTLQSTIEVRDDILWQIKDAFDKAGINAKINDLSGEMQFDSAILFKTESYELSEEGKMYIDQIMKVYASVVLDDSLDNVIKSIEFGGHTDSSGSYAYNQELSQKRAEAVLNYCIGDASDALNKNQKEKLKMKSEAKGYSYTDLVYDENGKEKSDESRRVEIKFILSESDISNYTPIHQIDRSGISLTEKSSLIGLDELVYDDFNLTDGGESFNMFEKGNGIYWDSSGTDTSTARGIKNGDSLSDVEMAYWKDQKLDFASSDFYELQEDEELREKCVSFVPYLYDYDKAIVAFFLDENDTVLWIYEMIP